MKKILLFLAVLIVLVVISGLFIETSDELSHQKEFSVSAADLWKTLGNFEDMSGFEKANVKFEFKGTGPGRTRSMIFPNGYRFTEKLESLDHEKMIFRYSVVNSPELPYYDYYGQLSVTPVDENSCMVRWDARYKTRLWKKISTKKMLSTFIDTAFKYFIYNK